MSTTTTVPAMPHAYPRRHYRAWWRTCGTCEARHLSDLLLTVHIRCNGCGRTMDQPPQGTAPDVDSVTEWDACTDGGWRCPDHRTDQ